PGAGLLDDPVGGAEVDQLAELIDAGAEQHLELRLAERPRALVLDHLDAHPRSHRLVALLELSDAADVETHRGVELERLTARRGLGIAEDDPDLLPQLVDEDDAGVLLVYGRGQLAQRLA